MPLVAAQILNEIIPRIGRADTKNSAFHASQQSPPDGSPTVLDCEHIVDASAPVERFEETIKLLFDYDDGLTHPANLASHSSTGRRFCYHGLAIDFRTS
jgi:hypothetical protein